MSGINYVATAPVGNLGDGKPSWPIRFLQLIGCGAVLGGSVFVNNPRGSGSEEYALVSVTEGSGKIRSPGENDNMICPPCDDTRVHKSGLTDVARYPYFGLEYPKGSANYVS